MLAALQDRPDYDSLLGELEEVVTVHPLGILTDPVHDLTRWAKGTRAAAAGDAFGTLHHLGRLRLPALTRMAAMERIDAAVRAGEPQLARQRAEDLAPFADATGRPWALATVAYGRAMTARPADADDLFQLALSHQARAGRSFDEARTHLAYGSGFAAPSVASTRVAICVTRLRPSRTCTRRHCRGARCRSCVLQGRRPANATRPPWYS